MFKSLIMIGSFLVGLNAMGAEAICAKTSTGQLIPINEVAKQTVKKLKNETCRGPRFEAQLRHDKNTLVVRAQNASAAEETAYWDARVK